MTTATATPPKKAKKPKPSSVDRQTITTIRKLLTKRPDQRKVPKKSQGKHTELGVCQFISSLLKVNEELPKGKKMTDETMRVALIEEFPTAKNVKKIKDGDITIGYYRTLYNLGHFNQGKKPSPKSKRYTDKGELANLRTGQPVA